MMCWTMKILKNPPIMKPRKNTSFPVQCKNTSATNTPIRNPIPPNIIANIRDASESSMIIVANQTFMTYEGYTPSW